MTVIHKGVLRVGVLWQGFDMVSRRGRMLWALAGLLVLVGCTPAEGEETAPPTVSETPAEPTTPVTDETGDDDASGGEDSSEDPSQPPEVEAPERPAEMDEETVDGAIAAAKYFVELYPYIYATGDLAEWDALSDDGCEFCNNSRELALDLTDDGGYATGGAVEVFSEEGGGPYENDVYAIQLGVRFDRSTFRYADGEREEHGEAERPEFRLSMLWRDGAWVVLGVLADPSETDQS